MTKSKPSRMISRSFEWFLEYIWYGTSFKYRLYAVMRLIGLKPLIIWYEQKKLDRARIKRFKDFCAARGIVRVKGKLVKK